MLRLSITLAPPTHPTPLTTILIHYLLSVTICVISATGERALIRLVLITTQLYQIQADFTDALLLFKLYYLKILHVFMTASWKHFTVTTFSKFISCYNKCVKKMLGFANFAKCDSMSGIFIK